MKSSTLACIISILIAVILMSAVMTSKKNVDISIISHTNRFSNVSCEYVDGESFRVFIDNNTKIEYLQTPSGIVMLREK